MHRSCAALGSRCANLGTTFVDFLLCSLKREVLQDIKKCDSLDHWLIVVDAAGTKRSVSSGIFDVLKKILPPQAKRCRLCVFAGSELQGLAMTMTKISEHSCRPNVWNASSMQSPYELRARQPRASGCWCLASMAILWRRRRCQTT